MNIIISNIWQQKIYAISLSQWKIQNFKFQEHDVGRYTTMHKYAHLNKIVNHTQRNKNRHEDWRRDRNRYQCRQNANPGIHPVLERQRQCIVHRLNILKTILKSVIDFV